MGNVNEIREKLKKLVDSKKELYDLIDEALYNDLGKEDLISLAEIIIDANEYFRMRFYVGDLIDKVNKITADVDPMFDWVTKFNQACIDNIVNELKNLK